MDKYGKLLVIESELIKMLGISRNTLRKWQEKYDFPKPLINISYWTHRYYLKEVEKWINKQHKINNKIRG